MKIPWPFPVKRVRTLRRRLDGLARQIEALSERMSALEAQTAANSAAHTALTVAERLIDMEARVRDDRRAVEDLARELSTLAERGEQDGKVLDQLKTAVLSIERQAQINAEEARRAAAALLERFELTRAGASRPAEPRRRGPADTHALPAGE